jgi:Amt family ammonium transporter
VAGGGCYLGIMAKNKFGYDDSLDVVGIHGVGGIIGLLAAGILASTAVNPDGANGLIYGNPSQLGIQCIAILATIVYTFIVTFILLKIVDKLMGLRVPEQEEISGLDLSQHDETAYIS